VSLPKEENTTLPIPIPGKYDSVPDEFPFISPSSGSGSISSPSDSPVTTSPATSVYPLAVNEVTESSQPAETTCAPWATEFKPSELGFDALNLLSTYDTMDSSNSGVHSLSSEHSPYDYRGLYENFGFNAIGDDALGSLSDHYQV
jgi:hypothetical protein